VKVKNKAAVSTNPNAQEATTEKPKRPTHDVAVVVGQDKQSGALGIVRQRANRIETGIVQPLKEGAPIHGEVIQLHQREGTPVYDVEVHVPAPAASRANANSLIPRPAQVATDKYRKNWDQIYRRASRRVLN